MKRLLFILILIVIFQSPTKADDIRDFQIEGMSIGDSLLDFFNEDEILKNDGNYYSKKKFVTTVFNKHRKIKNYDWLQISYKRNDSKFIIYSIDGVIEFKKNYKACLKKKDIVVNELSTLFDKNNTAIYFSRSPIPLNRSGGLPEQAYRHIGLYAYRAGYLQEFTQLAPCAIEQAEALEQLRALYNGGTIHVDIAVDKTGIGVDSADDLELARSYK